MFKWTRHIGPGTLIAAAFIGPGTVTVCTLAGVNHGYELLWAMLFSIFATIVLQEMSARIGFVTKRSISEIINQEISSRAAKVFSILLILSAILIGNAAYEGGNLSGAVLGFSIFLEEYGSIYKTAISVGIALLAFIILFLGNYKFLEKLLVAVVVMMSLSFTIAAIGTHPPVIEVLKGMFLFRIPSDSLLTIMALIGTTVVPYNLFLHAALTKEKWREGGSLRSVRIDLYVSILLGGLVSIMIIMSAAVFKDGNLVITDASDMARGLEPLMGSWSKIMIGVGLFAAGLTSAITAPLATAYVVTGLLGWENNMKGFRFRMVWIAVLVIGLMISVSGFKPVIIINYAQFTNGLLLPIIAGYLLWIVNKKSIVKNHRNTTTQNILGFIILIVTIALGLKSILGVLTS